MLNRRRRSRPLAIDALPALVDKQRRVAGAGVQLADVVRHQRAGRRCARDRCQSDRAHWPADCCSRRHARRSDTRARTTCPRRRHRRAVDTWRQRRQARQGCRSWTSGWSRRKSLAARSAPTGRIVAARARHQDCDQERTVSQAPPFPRGAREAMDPSTYCNSIASGVGVMPNSKHGRAEPPVASCNTEPNLVRRAPLVLTRSSARCIAGIALRPDRQRIGNEQQCWNDACMASRARQLRTTARTSGAGVGRKVLAVDASSSWPNVSSPTRRQRASVYRMAHDRLRTPMVRSAAMSARTRRSDHATNARSTVAGPLPEPAAARAAVRGRDSNVIERPSRITDQSGGCRETARVCVAGRKGACRRQSAIRGV